MTWNRKCGTIDRRFRRFAVYIRRYGPYRNICLDVSLQDETQRKEVTAKSL